MAYLATLVCFIAAAPVYEGHGILNRIEVGQDYAIEDIREIKRFSATYVETAERDTIIWFHLIIDDNANIAGLEEDRISHRPFLRLLRNNEELAVMWPRVVKGPENDGWWIEWKASAEFDEDSHFTFQLILSKNDFVTVTLPFLVARSTYVSRDQTKTRMKFSELRRKLLGPARRVGANTAQPQCKSPSIWCNRRLRW